MSIDMATTYHYFVREPETSAQSNATPPFETTFHIKVHYCHLLELLHLESNRRSINSSFVEHFYLANHLLSPDLGPTIMCEIFSLYGVSSNFLDTAIPQILAFARDRATDQGNAGRTVLPLEVCVFKVSTYNGSQELDRAVRESLSQDNTMELATRASVGALEKVSYEALSGMETEEMCAVCLDEFSVEIEEGLRRMPCSHVFHEGCIVRWLRRSRSCPLCRYVLPSSRSD